MINGYFDGILGCNICGWAWDAARPDLALTVEVLVDGALIATTRADQHRGDLQTAGVGNGRHAFFVRVPTEISDGRQAHLTIRIKDGPVLKNTPAVISLPNLVFRPVPPPAAAPPVTLAICAIVKNEAPYILEWIAHHRLVGVEHFVLLDNGSNDGTTEILSALAAAGVVDHVPWPNIPHMEAQRPAYVAGLARLGQRCRWVAIIDADEFLNPLGEETVPQILADFDTAGGLVVPWRMYGSNGQRAYTDDLLVRRFTRRARPESILNRFVKTIAQPRLIAVPDIHSPTLREGTLVDEFSRVVGSQGHPDLHQVPDARRLVLNHYFTKSWEEWQIKRQRGMASVPADSLERERPQHHFDTHDCNDIEDLTLASRAPAIQAEMARLRILMR